MTVTVSAPNGATVDFPDGTDHDTINRVMTQNFHPDASVRAAASPAAQMPTFEIVGPDGTYHLSAPDEHSAVAAWQAFQNRNTNGSANVSGPNPIGDDRAATVANLRGIPLAGAYVDKATAMLNAAAQPLLETGLSHADNYADRVAENEKTVKSAADKYETDHPVETAIGKTAAGVGALAPLGAVGPIARMMGMGGEALLPSAIKGAASFGALNAGDAALRGDSVGKGLATGVLGGAADRIAPDGITGRMLAYRRMLGGTGTELDGSASGGLNDFAAAQRVRQELSDEIQSARQSGSGNKARLLGGIMQRLDTSLENSSNGFRQANRNFASASHDIDAVQTGRDAAMRGRTEDTIPAFNALPASGQAAFRAGYVDPLVASTQGAAHGVNKARPFTSDAFRDEAAAIAPRNDPMQQRLAREQTMFETRAQAAGGSRTADNLADSDAMAVDPHLVGQVLTGNWHGAIGSALRAGHNALTGNTPAVRAAVGRMLLDRGVNPANLQAAIGQTVQRIQFVQNMARGVGRGVGNGLVIAGPSHRQSEPYRGASLRPLQ